MPKQAIAIVLLPPSNVMNLCVRLNREAWKKGKASLRFGKNMVPHICLAVGCIEDQDLSKLKTALNKIKIRPIKTHTKQISYFDKNQPGSEDNKAYLGVEKTKSLANLQKAVAKIAKPYLFYQAKKEMFFKSHEIKESTIKTVNHYMTKNIGNHYNPHISLKCWNIKAKASMGFTANQIAIFQLGAGCRCRKVLFKVYLND